MSMMLIVQFLVLTTVICGVLIFFLKKILFDSTQGAVNRLNRETEQVRLQQTELQEKIKQANEELSRRRKEADELVAKMKEEAEEKAKEAREQMVNKARQESEEILAKAQRTKDDLRSVLQKEAEMKATDFTVDILTNVLSRESSEALHGCIMEDFFKKLEEVNMEVITQDFDEAHIITAAPISKEIEQKLAAIIKKKMNRDVKITTSQDPKVISGAVLKLGSLTLDGSLSNMIKEEGLVLKEKIEKS